MKICVAYTQDDKRNKVVSCLEHASFHHEALIIPPSELDQIADSDIVVLCDTKDIAKYSEDMSAFISALKGNHNCVAMVLSCRRDDPLTGITARICLAAGADSAEPLYKSYCAEELERTIKQALRSAKQTDETAKESYDDDAFYAAFKSGLVNYYQPQYDIRSNTIAAVEVLPRIKTAEGTLLYPDSFLPFIERNQLHQEFFFCVLRMAILDLSLSSLDINISVNITKNNINDAAFYSAICDVLEEFRFNPKRLTLEITEQEHYLDTLDSLINITNLKMLGVGLSIDDFGTGFNSYSQLISLPFNELKVDGGFVKNAINHYSSQQVAYSAISLAQSLGLRCVAEGVEDLATLEYLRQNKVDYAQGYFLSKPLPINKLIRLVARSESIRRTTGSKKNNIVVLLVDTRISRLSCLKKALALRSADLTVLTASTRKKALQLVADKQVDFVICDETHGAAIESAPTAPPHKTRVFVLHESFVVERDTSVLYYKDASHLTANKIVLLIENHLKLEKELEVLSRLSAQEKAVLKMIYEGAACKKIARDLDISHKTVSTYKTRIFQKLGVDNNIECVRLLSSFSAKAINLLFECDAAAPSLASQS